MVDAAFFSLMVGLGEAYFSAYALALDASEIMAGLVAAVPMLAGAVMQLGAPYTIRRFGSHRRWVVGCAVVQSASFLLLPLAAAVGAYGVPVIFVAATIYWGAGLATGPAWNTWIEELVPRRIRTRFFARRVRLSQLCVMTGFIIAGVILQQGKADGHLLASFFILFGVAAVSRSISMLGLYRQREPSRGKLAREHVGLTEITGRLRQHAGFRLLWFLFAMQVAVQISGPYFTPFMLKQIGLNYLQYMVLVALGFLGKAAALPLWSIVARRLGALPLLWIGGFGIIPMAVLWVILPQIEYDMAYLCVLQAGGGVAWAAYELAFFLMFFEAIPRHERTSLLTLYNLGNAVAMMLGATVGALVLRFAGEVPAVYFLLFSISSLCRLGACLVLLPRVQPIHLKIAVPGLRTITLRPVEGGGLDRPVLPTIPETIPDATALDPAGSRPTLDAGSTSAKPKPKPEPAAVATP